MKCYIGSKIIQAKPMSSHEFLKLQGKPLDPYEPDIPGFFFVHHPDGYDSWSPADVFKTCYREIDPKEVSLVTQT